MAQVDTLSKPEAVKQQSRQKVEAQAREKVTERLLDLLVFDSTGWDEEDDDWG